MHNLLEAFIRLYTMASVILLLLGLAAAYITIFFILIKHTIMSNKYSLKNWFRKKKQPTKTHLEYQQNSLSELYFIRVKDTGLYVHPEEPENPKCENYVTRETYIGAALWKLDQANKFIKEVKNAQLVIVQASELLDKIRPKVNKI